MTWLGWYTRFILASIAIAPIRADNDLMTSVSKRGPPEGSCPLLHPGTEGNFTGVTIGIDPNNCGQPGNACGPGELCVVGKCFTLPSFGSDALHCGTSQEACLPGQWCYNGACKPIQVVADPRNCGDPSTPCRPGELCVNGACIEIEIGSNPFNCSGTPCDSGNWCLDGSCLPFILGSTTRPCETDDQCTLGASCHNGVCRPFYIGTDPYNCGSLGVECSAGDLCVSDLCRPLNISNGFGACRLPEENHPGNICYGDYHFPIHISTDSSSCGLNGQVCAGAEVCVSGICVPGLEYTEEVSTVGCIPSGIKLADTGSDGVDSNKGGSSNDGVGSGDGAGAGNEDDSNDGADASDGVISDDAGHSAAGEYTIPPAGHSCPSRNVAACGLCLNVFGDSDTQNCGGKACPGNQLCCRNSCIAIDITTNSQLLDCQTNHCERGHLSYADGTPSRVIELEPAQCKRGCDASEICISGSCIKVSGDPLNCSDARKTCPANNLCISGTCIPVDTGSDPENCGSEGVACASGFLCFAGSCLPIVGKPAPCVPACPSGEVCASGSCVAIQPPASCRVTIRSSKSRNNNWISRRDDGDGCPAGSVCIDNQCVLLGVFRDCGSPGNDCPDGDVCILGSCVATENPLGCGAQGVICGDEEICVGGFCVATAAPTNPASSSIPTTSEMPTSSETLPTTENPSTSDNRSTSETHIPTTESLAISKTLSANKSSTTSKTSTSTPDPSPVACDTNEDCDDDVLCQSGFCVAGSDIECATDTDCSSGETCADGVCLPKVMKCVVNSQCSNGAICRFGLCVDPCAADSDCSNGHTCSSGVCVASSSCTSKSDCSTEEVCDNGKCIPACKLDDDCQSGNVCFGGFCTPMSPGQCLTNAHCQPGETCADGSCKPGAATCASRSDCSTDEVCDNGRCIPACKSDDDCQTGNVCFGGFCTPMGPGQCLTNAHCQPGEICADGSCKPGATTCDSRSDCSTDEVCNNGTCIPACKSDNECEAGNVCFGGFCTPISPGQCLTNANCQPGEICADGSCKPGATTCVVAGDCDNLDTCLGGTCSCEDGQCVTLPSDVCRDEDCPDGYTCSRLGYCLPIVQNACRRNDQCEEDFFCSSAIQFCVSSIVDQCTEDAACADGYICKETFGLCVPEIFEDCSLDAGDTCPTNGFACTQFGFCLSERSRECQTTADCDAGMSCEPNLLVCLFDVENQCDSDSDCGQGELCDTFNSRCFLGPSACDVNPCEEGFYCDDSLFLCFQDIPLEGNCATTADCTTGFECNPLGMCLPVPGDYCSDMPCPDGSYCSSEFVCIPDAVAACQSDSDCVDPLVCNQLHGFCVGTAADDCDFDTGCRNGLVCTDGQCLTGCEVDTDCTYPGLICDLDYLVCTPDDRTPCTDISECQPGQLCGTDGLCAEDPDALRCFEAVDCKDGDGPCGLGLCACQDNFCVLLTEITPCSDASTCLANETCQNGVCVESGFACSAVNRVSNGDWRRRDLMRKTSNNFYSGRLISFSSLTSHLSETSHFSKTPTKRLSEPPTNNLRNQIRLAFRTTYGSTFRDHLRFSVPNSLRWIKMALAIILQQLAYLPSKLKPKKQKKRACYDSLPIDVKSLIVKYAIPDQSFIVNGDSFIASGSSVASLLQVNKEMRKLVEDNVSHFMIIGAPPDPGQPALYARFALDMRSASLKVVDMVLPEKFDPEGVSFVNYSLPFQKVLSISADTWSFPDWHPLRIANVGSDSWELFDFVPFNPSKSWNDKPELRLAKEVTFVHKKHGLISPITGFVPEEVLTHSPYCYALGGEGAGRGIWLGFRYFKGSRRVQCTPLISDEIESAWEDAAKVKKMNANSRPLITRIWIIEDRATLSDKPYHMWRNLRDPRDDDPAWI
ncbi:hypothetical protein EDB81DRAFT_762333 [Dactylonectria macrodidyma]|uniref:DUF7107 domain-containing protein n=1 Tax=Dactylonectria macrodidyma TaxID=307937 RepID=A0A9P9IX88_9HYPO|nr:hypothetical protein EDB81DRAFT_762333 [Dactylonectria macrodidyma]